MIHIFPLIVSKSINPNILPGISKVLEHYILIYQLDKITTRGRIITAATGFSKMAKKTFGLESGPPGSTKGEKFKDEPGDIIKQDKYEKDKKKDITKPHISGVYTKTEMDTKSLSVQPTWVSLDTGHGVKVVGVKVVPYQVDDHNIVNLLMYDKDLSGLELFITSAERKIASTAYSIWGSTFGKILKTLSFGALGSNIISGDPKDDVILGTTEFKKNVFIMVNSMNMSDEFVDNITTTKKLFNLGWSSLIINDDVSKKVTFCMKEFSGMCHSVPHSFLHAGLSRDIKTAYDDIMDVKAASTPIFSKMTKPSNLSSLFHEKHQYYDTMRLIMEQQNLNFINIVKAVKSKNYEKIDKELGGNGDYKKNIRTYEKLSWHTNNPELKNDINSFLEQLMIYLNNNLLLTDEGKEIFELGGINDHFELTSNMLTEKGEEFISSHYRNLLRKFVDTKEFDVNYSDSLLKSIHVTASDNQLNSTDHRLENSFAILSEDKSKFHKSLDVSKKVLNNSLPTVPVKVNHAIANVIALRSAQKGDGFMDQTKADLKDTVEKIRTYLSKDELNKKYGGIQKETIVSIIFVVVSLIAGVYVAIYRQDIRNKIGNLFSQLLKVIKDSFIKVGEEFGKERKDTSGNKVPSIKTSWTDFSKGIKDLIGKK